MEVVLTLFVLLAPGGEPVTRNVPQESLTECLKSVEAFLKSDTMATTTLRGAGCIVSTKEKGA
jgi:hypothetical protein